MNRRALVTPQLNAAIPRTALGGDVIGSLRRCISIAVGGQSPSVDMVASHERIFDRGGSTTRQIQVRRMGSHTIRVAVDPQASIADVF